MGLSNAELLQKATLTTADFGGTGEAPLSIEQVDRFIVLLANPQTMLPDVRRVTSRAAKWQEPVLDFSARIMHAGVEATRLADASRAKPATNVIEISTVLLRGEVPVSDEAFEDTIASASFSDSLMVGIADRVGADVEDLLINGDSTSSDPYYVLDDGWLRIVRTTGGNLIDATSIGQDYQAIFRQMMNAMPYRFLRNIETDGRFYVPKRLEVLYRDVLAQRGTPLGDLMLTAGGEVRYQGIPIKGVPNMAQTTGTPNTSSILLTNRNNLYYGVRRAITMEQFRDPREGATSFVVTTRIDAAVAIPGACVLSSNVDISV